MINLDFCKWTEGSLKEVSRKEEIPLNGRKIEMSKELRGKKKRELRAFTKDTECKRQNGD